MKIPYDFIYKAAIWGDAKLLQWYNDNFKFDDNWETENERKRWQTKNQMVQDAFMMASANGQVNVLDWWIRQKKLPLVVNSMCINLASNYGHINSLEWWVDSGLDLVYSQTAINSCEYTDVLDWWRDSGLEFKYSYRALEHASAAGDIQILEWWFAHEDLYHFRYDLEMCSDIIDDASKNNDIKILQFWHQSEFTLGYSTVSLDKMEDDWDEPWEDKKEIIPLWLARLEWWKNSGLRMLYTSDAVNKVSNWGHTEILDWWRTFCLQSESDFKYTSYAVDEASSNGYIQILAWWKRTCLHDNIEFKYTERAIDEASENGWIEVLEWWESSGYVLKYTSKEQSAKAAEEDANGEIIKWWKRL